MPPIDLNYRMEFYNMYSSPRMNGGIELNLLTDGIITSTIFLELTGAAERTKYDIYLQASRIHRNSDSGLLSSVMSYFCLTVMSYRRDGR